MARLNYQHSKTELDIALHDMQQDSMQKSQCLQLLKPAWRVGSSTGPFREAVFADSIYIAYCGYY